MRILIATVCVALAATACHSSASNVVRGDVTLLRQAHDGGVYPAALLSGKLVVRNGCVAMSGTDGPRFVMWSAAADLRSTGNGLEVVDAGGRAAAIGSVVTIGGGAGGREWAEGLVAGLPASCAADEPYGSYWIAAPGSLNEVPAPA